MVATLVSEKQAPEPFWPLILKLRPGLRLTDPVEFYAFCQEHAPWEFERSAKGELIVKMPTGGESGARNLRLSMYLGIWALTDGTGVGFDSNTGFEFPDGSMRAPDAAWVRKSRLAALTPEQKERFLPLVPDFVVELRSRTDRLTELQEKMQDYADAGVPLGLLLDPQTRRAHLYRPSGAAVVLHDPELVDCSPELTGFILAVREIFDATL